MAIYCILDVNKIIPFCYLLLKPIWPGEQTQHNFTTDLSTKEKIEIQKCQSETTWQHKQVANINKVQSKMNQLC